MAQSFDGGAIVVAHAIAGSVPGLNWPISLMIRQSTAKTDSLRRAQHDEGAKTTSRQRPSRIELTRVKGIAARVL
jgi:hypothetical protein